MENVISRITVDVATDNNFGYIKAVQGDSSTRYAYITLLDNSQPYVLSGTETVVLRGEKPDNTTIFNHCYFDDNKNIVVELTPQLLAVAGEGKYEISLYGESGSDSVLTSFPFIIYVYESTDVEPITSSDEFTALTHLINSTSELTAILNQAETARDASISASDESKRQADLSAEKAQISTDKAVLATEKAAKADASAILAKQSEIASANSVDSANNYANLAKSYAIGNTGNRTGENTDNAKYYKDEAERILANVTNAWIPKGTILFSELPSSPISGWIYNISDGFVSTSNFADGGGVSYPSGTNVYCSEDGKWNCQVVTIDVDNSELDTIKTLIGSTNISSVGTDITDAISNLSNNLSTRNEVVVANKVQVLKKENVSDDSALKIEDASAIGNTVMLDVDWNGNATFNGDVVSTDSKGKLNSLNNKQDKLVAGDNISLVELADGKIKINASGNEDITMKKDNPVGTGSFSMNRRTDSDIGRYSTAIGYVCTASGDYSYAEGFGTEATVYGSHAEGDHSYANGYVSHAEGNSTTASGSYSHSQNNHTIASGYYSHAEGTYTTSSGWGSHSEGYYSSASGDYSHAEGYRTLSNSNNSHAEGEYSKATSDASHAEGSETLASGRYSHSEGTTTIASGNFSHAEGNYTKAQANGSHSQGSGTIAKGCNSHAEGQYTIATADESHVGGRFNKEDTESKYAEIIGNGSRTLNYDTWEWDEKRSNARTLDWDGNAWFAGDVTATDKDAHEHVLSKKQDVLTPGKYITINKKSGETIIDVDLSGYDFSYVIGSGGTGGSGGSGGEYLTSENPTGTGSLSINRGGFYPIGDYSTTLGSDCLAGGDYSFSQGVHSIADGSCSFAQGYYCIAEYDNQFVIGKYNEDEDTENCAFIIGGGSNYADRKNIFTVDWDGNVTIEGNIKAKGINGIPKMESVESLPDDPDPNTWYFIQD